MFSVRKLKVSDILINKIGYHYPDPLLFGHNIPSPFIPHCVVWSSLVLNVDWLWKRMTVFLQVVVDANSTSFGKGSWASGVRACSGWRKTNSSFSLSNHLVPRQHLPSRAYQSRHLCLLKRVEIQAVCMDSCLRSLGWRHSLGRSSLTQEQKPPDVKVGWPLTFAFTQIYWVAFLFNSSPDHKTPLRW